MALITFVTPTYQFVLGFFASSGFSSIFEEEVIYTPVPPTFEYIDTVGFNDVCSYLPIITEKSLIDNYYINSEHPDTPDYSFWRRRSKSLIYIDDVRPVNYWMGDVAYVYYIEPDQSRTKSGALQFLFFYRADAQNGRNDLRNSRLGKA